jgi:hypothetical protein
MLAPAVICPSKFQASDCRRSSLSLAQSVTSSSDSCGRDSCKGWITMQQRYYPQHRLIPPKNAVHLSHSGLYIHPLEDAGLVLGTSSVLADYVDGMADWDIACSDQTQALTVKVIPGTAPLLVIHYRTPIASAWQFGSSGFSQPDYRHFATMHQTGVVVSRVRALGIIGVRLRPEAAACLLGEHMQYFLDARIGLDDLFGTSPVSLLVEMLAEARTSAERLPAWNGSLLRMNG